MRVLLTGAAGSIGRVVTVGLADRGHRVIGLDRVVEPEGFDGPWHSVDCADPDAVASVFEAESPDAVVHLAGKPDEGNLPESLTSHVVTTAALLDAMAEHDVQRIVYASSNHAVGRTPRPADPSTHIGDDLRPRPDTFYGVSKVAAEALLSLYAVLYGISANTRRWWDLEPGRRLGYEPVDDAEEFAATVPARPEDDFEAAHVGGPFAGEEFYRPALERS